MHDSHLPLRTWFLAIFLMCESKKGMSAHQLWRTLGIGSYKTAWYLCHRIREAMGNDPLTGPTLVGVIEVDETMVGGKRHGPDWRDNKHWVAGAIERGGRVRIERIPDVPRSRSRHPGHTGIADLPVLGGMRAELPVEDAMERLIPVTQEAQIARSVAVLVTLG